MFHKPTKERKRELELQCADIDAEEAKKELLNGNIYVARSRIESAMRVLHNDSQCEVPADFTLIALAIKEYNSLRST